MTKVPESHPFYKMIEELATSDRHRATLRFGLGYTEFESDLAFEARDPADDVMLEQRLPMLSPRGRAAVHALVKKSL